MTAYYTKKTVRSTEANVVGQNSGLPDKPLVSVVIPTFNSERFLNECLTSVRKQACRSTEIIIVDNYSGDRTRIIAEMYGASVVLARANVTRARNIGLDLADGEYVLSLDSDMVLTPNVIAKCVAKMKKGFDAVVIPEVSVGTGFWAECRALEKVCYICDDLIESARFFRKKVLEDVGGYDVCLAFGEDRDLHLRIKAAGYRIGRVDVLIKHFEGKLALYEDILKKYRYGKTSKPYLHKHPQEATAHLRIVRPAFLRNHRLLMRDPLHSLGMFVMKSCEFVAFRAGQLITTTKTTQFHVQSAGR